MCVFGPDSSGAYHEEIVPESSASKCDIFCVCHELKTMCLMGPDSSCNFATAEVDRAFADSCEKDFCTCTSHEDYMETANSRLNSNSAQMCLTSSNPQSTETSTVEPASTTTEASSAPESQETLVEKSVETSVGKSLDSPSSPSATFNGHSISDTSMQIQCRIGPDPKTGGYVDKKLTLQSYELICKTTSSDFCVCDFDDSLSDR